MRILLIEDDMALCRSLSSSLEKQGFAVTVCHDGEEGLYAILENAHDLVLLDRMLPGLDGLSVLRRARSSGQTVPILCLTALGELHDKIDGLDAGADDYLVKPFAFEELMARIRCLLRRPPRLQKSNRLSFEDLHFDLDQSLLSGPGGTCTCSRREGELLTLFLTNPNQILPRGAILSRVWGSEAEIESGNLDNYIHFLRRRLHSVKSQVGITTVRGIGYRMQLRPEA